MLVLRCCENMKVLCLLLLLVCLSLGTKAVNGQVIMTALNTSYQGGEDCASESGNSYVTISLTGTLSVPVGLPQDEIPNVYVEFERLPASGTLHPLLIRIRKVQ